MKIGNYKGLHVHRPNLAVQEKEIDNVLKREQRRHAVVLHVEDGGSIRKIPEFQPIDDEFARDFSDYDTLAEWRLSIRESLEERRRISAEEKLCRELLALVIADSDIPVGEELVQEVTFVLYNELLDDLEDRSMSLEKYLKRTRMTEEALIAAKKKEALLAIRSETVLREIANREDITVSPQELADEITAMAQDEGMDPAELAEELDEEDYEEISDQILMDKAMEFIIDNAEFMD